MRLTWHKSDKAWVLWNTNSFSCLGMPSSLQPLEITWREPPEVWKKVNSPWFWRQLLFQWVAMEQPKKKTKNKKTHHFIYYLTVIPGPRAGCHVFCILQLDQVPSSQTKNLKLMNISCHGQCWMRYRHIHVWNPIWEMLERRKIQPYIKRPGLCVPGLNTRWDRKLTLLGIHCFILSRIHFEGSFCARMCHCVSQAEPEFLVLWGWCVEVSHITSKRSGSPAHRSSLLSHLQYCIGFKCTA